MPRGVRVWSFAAAILAGCMVAFMGHRLGWSVVDVGIVAATSDGLVGVLAMLAMSPE